MISVAKTRIVSPVGSKGDRAFDVEVSSDGGVTWAVLPTSAAIPGTTHELRRSGEPFHNFPIAQIPVAIIA
jgi:hypothetical protein